MDYEDEFRIDTYSIYQLKDSADTRDYRFEPLDRLEQRGLSVAHENYNLVYADKLTSEDTLEGLYQKFNLNHPEDFKGHSLSVSDVVVLCENGKETAHYCDSLDVYKRQEQAVQKANVDFLYHKTLAENPQIAGNPVSRFLQKRQIKKNYAKGLRNAEKAAQKTSQAVKTTTKATAKAGETVSRFVAVHWKGCLVVLALSLIIMALAGGISSLSLIHISWKQRPGETKIYHPHH